MFSFWGDPGRQMHYKIIAHRGYSSAHPENTLTAIKAALQSTPASGIEIDLHRTSDNLLILQHDEDLERMTDGSGRIEDQPYFGYIDGLKTKGNGEPVSLLSQVLDYLKTIDQGNLYIVLDVKDDQSLQVLECLKSLGIQNASSVIFLGVWNDEFAQKANELFPPAAHPNLLVTLIAEEPTSQQITSNLYRAFNLNVDNITEDAVKEIKDQGKKILLWTCNAKEQVDRAKALNVDGILTDDPFLV